MASRLQLNEPAACYCLRTLNGGTVTLNGREPLVVLPSVITTTMLAASALSPFSGVKTISSAAMRALSVAVPQETLSGISEMNLWVASGDWHWGELNLHCTMGFLEKVITLKCVSGSNWWMNWIRKVLTRTKFLTLRLLDESTMRHTSSFLSSHGDGSDKKYTHNTAHVM